MYTRTSYAPRRGDTFRGIVRGFSSLLRSSITEHAPDGFVYIGGREAFFRGGRRIELQLAQEILAYSQRRLSRLSV